MSTVICAKKCNASAPKLHCTVAWISPAAADRLKAVSWSTQGGSMHEQTGKLPTVREGKTTGNDQTSLITDN